MLLFYTYTYFPTSLDLTGYPKVKYLYNLTSFPLIKKLSFLNKYD